jgi:transcriptional regulator with PAS, ATPase and Fis domain
LPAQSKLLRVLEYKKVNPLGDEKEINLDVRIIAACNVDLLVEVKQNRFRKDLYYRLNVLPLKIPNLRQRPEDIPLLAEYFIKIYSKKDFESPPELEQSALRALLAYHWPGNVRELSNSIERAVVICQNNIITERDLSLNLRIDKTEDNHQDKTLKKALNSFKQKYLEQILEVHLGNKTEAAKALGIQRTYLSRLIKELEINT